jgi:Domain of Unknown Function (DUF1259)
MPRHEFLYEITTEGTDGVRPNQTCKPLNHGTSPPVVEQEKRAWPKHPDFPYPTMREGATILRHEVYLNPVYVPRGLQAAIIGDFVLIDKEVNAVAKSLRQHGVDVTAIHNHTRLWTCHGCFTCIFWPTTPQRSWRRR